tara:strand:- start:291 stop:434 length:144 start_codon:yes stop_codon:yes gene_type:complete
MIGTKKADTYRGIATSIGCQFGIVASVFNLSNTLMPDFPQTPLELTP